MSTIYELSQEQQDLLNALYWDEESPEESNRLEQIQLEVTKKLEFLSTLKAEAEARFSAKDAARKEALARLTASAKREERIIERLDKFILETMLQFNIKKVQGKIINITVINRIASVMTDGFDIEKLPDEFVKIEKTPIKRDIEAYLKADEENTVPGFTLAEKPYLRAS